MWRGPKTNDVPTLGPALNINNVYLLSSKAETKKEKFKPCLVRTSQTNLFVNHKEIEIATYYYS